MVGYQEEKLYFNGRDQECISTTTENGTHGMNNSPNPPSQPSIQPYQPLTLPTVWVQNGGITGRGVLLDYRHWADTNNITAPVIETHAIPLRDLLAVAASQNTTFKKGDILLVRTGYIAGFDALPAPVASAQVAKTNPEAIGVESSAEILEWLWNTGFAAVAGDKPSFEAWPCQDKRFWFHEWLLAGWGMPIGELFDLERLAGECRRLGKWSFFFSSVPLYVPGGVASPPNGVAIL